MKISIFGLGYVGAVTGACLAEKGHKVLGVDINREKVSSLNRGKSPIIEKGLNKIVSAAFRNKRLSATGSVEKAVTGSDVLMLCVGTPSDENGAIDLEILRTVCSQIGAALKSCPLYRTIVVRSTVLPGTTEGLIMPELEKTSGKKTGVDFGVCVNPEFMREGNSVEDFYSPAKTIVGAGDGRERKVMKKIYSFIKAPFIATDIKTAEISKYLDNVFHGVKICFANEIGELCRIMGVDPQAAIDVFLKDKKSNISPRYLRPGFAFGGSCIPKDLRAVLNEAKVRNLDIPLMNSIVGSNDTHIYRAFKKISATGKKKIAVLGLSFKPGTDDLRESQMVRLCEMLIGKGFNLRIYDRNVSMARLTGANRRYINKEIPHISSLLSPSLEYAIKGSEVIVIGHNTPDFKKVKEAKAKRRVMIDLTE